LSDKESRFFSQFRHCLEVCCHESLSSWLFPDVSLIRTARSIFLSALANG
jgi:hypothetical protein